MIRKIGTGVVATLACVIALAGRGRQWSPQAPTITNLVEVSGANGYLGENSHLERVTFKMPSSGGDGQVPPPGTTNWPGATGTTGSTGTTGTSGSTGGSGPYYVDVSTGYAFAVVNWAGYIKLSDDAGNVAATEITWTLPPPPAMGGTQYDVYQTPVNLGDTCTLRIPPSTQSFQTIWLRTDQCEQYYEDAQGAIIQSSIQYYTAYTWVIDGYTVSRLGATVVAVDSRLAFGQPNLEGALPGDPNAPPSNVRFNPYIYRGGIFSGNANFLDSNDLSGTARVEVQATLPQTTHEEFEAVTLTNLGSAPNFTTPAKLSAYLVGGNVSTDFNNATWANAWPVPTGDPGNPVDFTSFPNPEYANFPIPSGSSGLVAIACSNEASVISSKTSEWEYFSTPAYIAALTTVDPATTLNPPLSDASPRIWLADRASETSNFYTTPLRQQP